MANVESRQATKQQESANFIIDPLTGEKFPVGDVVIKSKDEAPSLSFLTEAQSALIAAIPDADLSTLVMRSLASYGAISGMSEQQTAQAILDRFAQSALTEDIGKAVQAGKEWFDRTRGKPLGASPTINIGAGSEQKKIQVVFVTPEEVRRQREANAIDVTPYEK